MEDDFEDIGVSLGDMRKRGGDDVADAAEVLMGNMNKARRSDGEEAQWRRFRVIDVKDCSGSMQDEYENGSMERADALSLAFASTLDRGGYAHSVFFGTHAEEAREKLTLENHAGHVRRNRPAFGYTNLADGIRVAMRIIARELNVPAVLDLIDAPLPELRRKGGFLGMGGKVERTGGGLQPVQLPIPVMLFVKFDGRPYVPGRGDAERDAIEMFIRLSYTGAFAKVFFVANEGAGWQDQQEYEKGKKFCQDLDDLKQNDERMLIDNVDTVIFGDGMNGMTKERFGIEVVRELPDWLSEAEATGLLAPA